MFTYPTWECPYCSPRCPCCGRPLRGFNQPYITYTNTYGSMNTGQFTCNCSTEPNK